MAPVRHVGFSKSWFLSNASIHICWFSITVTTFVQKCWSTPKLWPKIEIRHLVFSKPHFWAMGPLGCLFSVTISNLVQKCWSTPKLYGPKSKSKMAAVRHLGIDASSYRTIHEVFSLGHISPPNFMQIRWMVLKIWRFEFFCRFGLKFTLPKFRFWGSEPLNVIDHHRDPQRHIYGRNRVYMPILISPLVRLWTVREPKESKKKKKTRT